MNFVDIKKFGKALFDKQEYEDISEYFVSELDVREKRMDSLLLEVDKMNKKYEEAIKNTIHKEEIKEKDLTEKSEKKEEVKPAEKESSEDSTTKSSEVSVEEQSEKE